MRQGMLKLVLELLETVKSMLDSISDVQIRLEELEENSHPPVDWEEIIHANTQRIEYLERKLSEREPQ